MDKLPNYIKINNHKPIRQNYSLSHPEWNLICLGSTVLINVPSLLYSISSNMIWYDPYSCLNLKKHVQISTTEYCKKVTTICARSLQMSALFNNFRIMS